nr:MAG TPA: hypothetical protein [Caudoviricetes sp.]
MKLFFVFLRKFIIGLKNCFSVFSFCSFSN